jgi:hypothetical protein
MRRNSQSAGMTFIVGLVLSGFLIFLPSLSQATKWDLDKTYETNVLKITQVFKIGDYVYKYKVRAHELGFILKRFKNGEEVNALEINLGVEAGDGFFIKPHNGNVYAFATGSFFTTNPRAAILRSSDGIAWEEVYSRPYVINSCAYFVDAVSQGEELYVVDGCGILLKGSGQGNPLSWTTIPAPLNLDNVKYGDLFVFKGDLHLAHNPHGKTSIFRMDNGQWESTPVVDIHWNTEFGSRPKAVKFAVTKDRLYMGHRELWSTAGEETPGYIWEKDETFTENMIIPIIVSERLYVWSSDNPVMEYSPRGTWEEASSSITSLISNFDYGQELDRGDVVDDGHHYFVMVQGNLWKLKKGFTGLTNTFTDQGYLFSFQEQAVVMRLKVTANISDQIKFSVRNLGTAVQGRDIERVWLIKLNEAQNEKGDILGEFISQDQDPKRWSLDQYVDVNHGDDLAIAVDVSGAPLDGVNCVFSVEQDGFMAAFNDEFELPASIGSAASIEIKNNPAVFGVDTVSNFVIYPQPARDQVRFQYNLDSTSDVTIKIFNRKGKLVSELSDPGKGAATPAKTTWNASSVAPGTYYARIKIQPHNGPARQYTKSVFIEE